MPTAKPKWGGRSSAWLPLVRLGTDRKREIIEFIGQEPPKEFFADLQEIITVFYSNRELKDLPPRVPEIRMAIKYLTKDTKKLLNSLENRDSHSRSLIGERQFLKNHPEPDVLRNCEKALRDLCIVLELAQERIPKKRGGAPRKTAKKDLAIQLAKLFARFSINLRSQQFDDCLSLVLE